MIREKIYFLPGIFLLFLSLAIPSFSQEENISKKPGFLEEIIFSKIQDTLEVKIFCQPFSSHRQFILPSPNRVVVDFHNMIDIKGPRYIEVSELGIQAIRAGMYKSDVARVVFDLEDKFIPYKIEKIQGGVKITFFVKEPPEIKSEGLSTEETLREEPEEEVVKKSVPESKETEKAGKETEAIAVEKDEKLEETREILDDVVSILDQIQTERLRTSKRFVRIATIGNYFQPSDKVLKDVYKGGMMYGAELNVGIWNFVEFWLAEKYFSKRVVEEASGEEMKINIIPFEAGLKIRLNKGVVNPYLGGGVGYYQYKEINTLEEIKDKKIGYIGLAGCFLKISGGIIFDIYAHYSYCQIAPRENRFNVGGFHVGVGFGFEY